MMHAAHSAHMAKASPPAAALPAAPMIWAHARFDELNDPAPGAFGGSFADVALADDDFDAPVYRSLGDVMGCSMESTGGLDLAVEDESPRYRSFGVPPDMAEDSMTAEDADRAWLESMPPLIRRQNAEKASFVIP